MLGPPKVRSNFLRVPPHKGYSICWGLYWGPAIYGICLHHFVAFVGKVRAYRGALRVDEDTAEQITETSP